MQPNGQLDEIDLKILDILQQDGRLDTTKIGAKVHRSFTATKERIRQMQEGGVIIRYKAVLDRRMIGRPTLMVILVKLNTHAASTLRDFSRLMNEQAEVEICLHLSGEYDFLLQVSMRDPSEYERFLDSFLLDLPMIDRIHSSLVLRECKTEAGLPLNPAKSI